MFKLPVLNLPNSLKLENVFPKVEPLSSKMVYICLPFSTEMSISEFKGRYPDIQTSFGKGARVVQISQNPEKLVLIGDQNADSPIPSLQMLDSAYQNISNLPFLIDQCQQESISLEKLIENSIVENESLQNHKEKLISENASLQEELRSIESDILRLSDASQQVKRSFEEVLSKLSDNL